MSMPPNLFLLDHHPQDCQATEGKESKGEGDRLQVSVSFVCLSGWLPACICLSAMFVCCKLLLLLFSRRVKSAVTFSSLSVDELCDYVTSFEHGKVQCVGVGGGGDVPGH